MIGYEFPDIRFRTAPSASVADACNIPSSSFLTEDCSNFCTVCLPFLRCTLLLVLFQLKELVICLTPADELPVLYVIVN